MKRFPVITAALIAVAAIAATVRRRLTVWNPYPAPAPEDVATHMRQVLEDESDGLILPACPVPTRAASLKARLRTVTTHYNDPEAYREIVRVRSSRTEEQPCLRFE